MSIVRSISEGLSAHARLHALAYTLAILLATNASISAFIDTFGPLTREQLAGLAWWQVLALVAKCLQGAVAALIALLVKSPVAQPKAP